MRGFIGVMGLVVALTACGSGGTAGAAPASTGPAVPGTSVPSESVSASTPPPTGPNVSGCYHANDGKIFTYDGSMPGIIGGTGSVGVVITYERRGTVCSWRPLFDRLAPHYRVLVYTRSSQALPEDTAVAMARRLLKERGVERVFMLGGSIGATTAVPAALRLGPKVAGVVAVSGQISQENAGKLTVPLLQIGSEHDGYGGADDLTRSHDAATKAPDNELLVIPGESLHASALLTGPHSKQVLDKIDAFMARHKG
ncbi:hypothetical protein [Nonomuraea sp. NPDC049784]|uniref:alpha/beta fold hydrolase n=1 Tax=Nonomuraea sp. NPDC049784 TaxID=3154361 RepID=UPI0033E39E7B